MAAPPLQRMLRRAARRDLYARVLHRMGCWLAIAAGVGMAVLLIDRWAGMGIPAWVWGAIAVVATLIAAMHAFITRPGDLALAVQLDHALRLKDRVGSALAVEHRVDQFSDPEFAELLKRDAASLAGRVDIAAATPIHLTGVWGIALLINFMLWAGVLFLPNFAALRATDADAQTASLRQAQLEAQQQARDLIESIRQTTTDIARSDQLSPGQNTDSVRAAELAALDRLAEQLAPERQPRPEEIRAAREEAAAHLEQLAQRAAEQARQERLAAEELRRRFAGIERREGPPPPMTAQQFADALKRGDFGQATEELQRLLNESHHDYSQGERDASADLLRDLADLLAQAGESSRENREERLEQVRQAMRDLGVDEQAIEELIDARDQQAPLSPDEAAQLLREQGIDQDTAQRLLRELQNLQQQQQLDEQVDRDSRELRDSLERAADAIERGELPPSSPPEHPLTSNLTDTPTAADQPPPSPLEQTPPREGVSDPARMTDPPGSQPESSPPAAQPQQRPPAEPPPATPTPQGQPDSAQQQPRQQDQQQSGQDQTAQQTPPQQQSPAQTPTGTQQQGQQQSEPGSASQQPASQQPTSDRPTAVAPPGDPTQPPQPGGTQQQQQSRDAAVPQQGAEGEASQAPLPTSAPDASQLPDPPAPGENPAFDETLRRMAERARNAQQQQEQAERLADMARQLADNMTPEQRRRWAEALQRERGNEHSPPDASRTPPPQPSEPDRDIQSADGETDTSQQQTGDAGARDPSQRQSPPPRDTQGRGERRAGTSDAADRLDPNQPRIESDAREIMDLRGHETAERIIAQWLSDTPPPDGAPAAGAGTTSSSAAQRVQQAQRIAERAVNDAAVNKRYHRTIQRYFGRLPEAIDRAARGQAPATDESSPPPPASSSQSP